MSNHTPEISVTTINETVVRITAGFVSIITIATIITQWYLLPLYLATDFFIRAFAEIKSPLSFVSQYIAIQLKLPKKKIYAPPKKFAAAVGVVFSFLTSVLFYENFNYAALVVAGILLICSLLEAIFGICVGCYVYNWVVVPLNTKFKIK